MKMKTLADVYAGGTTHLAIDVANTGLADAHDVVLTVTLPPTGALALSDDGGCTVAGATLTCAIASLPSGDTTTITLTFVAATPPSDDTAAVVVTDISVPQVEANPADDLGPEDRDQVVLLYCGDGIVSGPEQCDGGVDCTRSDPVR